MSDNRPVGGYTNPSQQSIFLAEVVNNKDDVAMNRFQCRMIGHESDLINIPDSDLQWYSPLIPDGVQGGTGYNPRYLPGDKVWCMTQGEERIILGAVRKEDPNTPVTTKSVNPTVSPSTGSPHHRPPHTTDPNFGWKDKIPSEAIQSQGDNKTQYTRTSIEHKRNDSKIKQGQDESKNQYGRTSTKSKRDSDKSIGRQNKFDGSSDAMSFIKNRIGNKGSLVPSLLDAVKNTIEATNSGQNPDPISAAGASTFAAFLKEITAFLEKLPTEKRNRKEKQSEQAVEDKKIANDGDDR